MGRNGLPCLINEERNRPARPPGRGNQANQAENNEHHADGADSLPRQGKQFLDRKPAVTAITEKDNVAKGQGVQDRCMQHQTE